MLISGSRLVPSKEPTGSAADELRWMYESAGIQ
jgi:hypothetical protein